MATPKIAISLDEGTVQRLDRLVKDRIFPAEVKSFRMRWRKNLRSWKRAG
jgi:hypothetical protein